MRSVFIIACCGVLGYVRGSVREVTSNLKHHGKKTLGEAVTQFEYSCPTGMTLNSDGNTCTKINQVKANSKCPAGYSKSGNSKSISCAKVDVTSAVSICPEGFEQAHNSHHKGNCIMEVTIATESFCPANFQLMGKECTKIEILPAKKACLEGSKQDKENCVSIKQSKPEENCPDGFEYTSAGCLAVSSVEAAQECPSGYEQQGGAGDCSKVEIADPSPFCPSGKGKYSPEAGCRLLSSQLADEVCPEGYIGPDKKGRCVQTTIEELEQYCPTGYEGVGKECSRTVTVPFEVFCDVGEQTVDGCTQTVTTQALATCPVGYTASSERASSVKGITSAGHRQKKRGAHVVAESSPSSPSSVSCTMIEEVKAEFFCPLEFTDSGEMECTKMTSTPAVAVCPAGSTKHSGKSKCVNLSQAPAVAQCPPDYTLENGACLQMSTAEKEMECPVGYAKSEVLGSDGGALCEKCSVTTHKTSSSCEYKPANYVCPHSYAKQSSKECVKVETVDVEFVCPEGFETIAEQKPHHGGSKKALHYKSKTKGTAAVVSCLLKEYVAEEYECPVGTVYETGDCVSSVVVAKQVRCPEGYGAGGSSSKHHHNKQAIRQQSCSRPVSTPAVLSCSEPTVALQGDVCVDTAVSALQTKCPQGYIANLDVCERVETANPLARCSEGFMMTGGQCVMTTYTGSTAVCPDDYDLVNTQCMHEIVSEAEMKCPTTYELVGDMCTKQTAVKPRIVCQSGYQLDLASGSCQKTTKSLPVQSCPQGFSMERANKQHGHIHNTQKDVCIQHVVSAVQVTCPAGYELDNYDCSRLTSAAVLARCPSGYLMKHAACVKVEQTQPSVACPEGYDMVFPEEHHSKHALAKKKKLHHHQYKTSGGQCVITATTEAQYFCTKGYAQEGEYCVKTQTVASTRTSLLGYVQPTGPLVVEQTSEVREKKKHS
eukprot:TRINITY_DN13767_c0_g1_i1.p1 TRINITY_DN13767_c0_g1~~TRINITY_DN13767_c0_g1_i1.p1  ORF type:complete len:938 (-),score=124.71 TRINITY_DN13767_c0_g1_i1:245-3058(-)